jgi:glycosyltransferase involved in cell wall biosynthesis
LRECLESLTSQTIVSWEAIVVDDSSPDGHEIANVVEELADSRVRVVRHKTNRGLAAARNTGFREAKADWVLPLDSDDKLDPEFLEKTLADTRPGVDLVFTDFWRFGIVNEIKRYRVQSLRENIEHRLTPGPGVLTRRSLWDEVGGYCEAEVLRSGMEDREFWISVLEQGPGVSHVPEPLYHYRTQQTSMVTKMQFVAYRNRAYIYNLHKSTIDTFGLGPDFLSQGFWLSADAHQRSGNHVKFLVLALRAIFAQPNRRNFSRFADRLRRYYRSSQGRWQRSI